jgi:hypothetical protein
VYLANLGRFTPEIEPGCRMMYPILREPFTPAELRSVVGHLLSPGTAA